MVPGTDLVHLIESTNGLLVLHNLEYLNFALQNSQLAALKEWLIWSDRLHLRALLGNVDHTRFNLDYNNGNLHNLLGNLGDVRAVQQGLDNLNYASQHYPLFALSNGDEALEWLRCSDRADLIYTLLPSSNDAVNDFLLTAGGNEIRPAGPAVVAHDIPYSGTAAVIDYDIRYLGTGEN